MRRSIIRITIVVIALAGTLFLLGSAAFAGKKNSSKESVDECCKKNSSGEADKKSWEILSRQFFSSI